MKQLETKEDVESILTIDKYKLDQECVSHASYYYRFSEMAVEARAEANKLNDDLKVLIGNLSISIRDHHAKNDLKITENIVAALIEKDEKVIALKGQIREAELLLVRLQARVSAMEHRKSQLDNLVKLYCAGYFAVPLESNKAKEAETTKAGREARGSLNKKKKEV